jgi:hypothetical protein
VSCRVVSERCSFATASLACSPARHPLIIYPKAPPQIENGAEQRQNATRRVTHELLNYLPCTSVVAKTVDLRILSRSFHALHANLFTSVCHQNWSEGHIQQMLLLFRALDPLLAPGYASGPVCGLRAPKLRAGRACDRRL